MPFDEEDDNDKPTLRSQKTGLKQVSTQKSIFENMPKKPGPEKLEEQVKKIQEKDASYKAKASELTQQFKNALEDKTLAQNKNVFSKDLEKDLLTKMVQLAVEINNDPNEQEGMGSLSWITLLLKVCFYQRDKINDLEYKLFVLQKKIEPANLSVLITQEISRALDNKKKNE